MSLRQKVLFGSVLFSWFMVFLSWIFAYSIEIMADWILLALLLSSVYGFILYRNRARKFIENPEALR